MAKLFKVDVTYYICADNDDQAQTAVVMASSQIYESMKSRDVSHTANVGKRDVFHAHQLPNLRS